MTANSTLHIRQYIQDFRFEDLFIEELGWDQYRDQPEVMVEDEHVTLNAFAEKRGMVAFQVSSIPEHKLRRKIEQQVAKSHRENIIIYTDPQQTQQIWQWVRREPGKPLANRELRYHQGQSGEAVAQVLDRIKVSLEEEDDITIVDVTSRVRAAFDVERVTKKFYDRFKKQHDAFLKFIDGIPDEDFQRWYASVMLNRLMFIYFVQRKSFLDGDINYLRNGLARTEGNFYRDFLCPLFFEGFAKKEHAPEVRRLLGDVPYLNGGLFLQHQIEELYGDAIQIENTAFEKLFDFFDEYQWHLDERPLHDDNEINPDVLGYIFEKYINQKQMGAYYTKEDITEYISKNTVIPFLFDEVRREVNIAFEGDHTVWDLLVENPDRYVYSAMKYGTILEDGTIQYLPNEIAAGIKDVAKRSLWNTSTPSEYGLPTEIWRETVARRERYQLLHALPLNGEITSINDLITYNYDIQQFAQDVIDYTDSPDVVRAFWKAINNVTVLDPTCGSGAFLFAALNILEPLYEACLERMEGFVAELERIGGGHPQQYSDFREVLARIEQHPNRRYFILKSIIVNNLFGVDIMEEAVEICKLRLFLKLVAQVDDKQRIEPLPDIDFNIRVGNTLVGFVTKDSVWQAMTTDAKGNPKMVFGEEQSALKEIERNAEDVDRLFGLFRYQQTELDGDVRPEDKQSLREKLRELENELNWLLAVQYGVDPDKDGQYAKWLKSHQPFHWFVEFYGVLKSGGFDMIIGNPPYVELKAVKEYKTIDYECKSAGNLYALMIERGYLLGTATGRQGYIVPVSSISTTRYSSLQRLLSSRNLYYSSFDDRPSRLFDGLEHIRLTIHLISPASNGTYLHSTRYNKWSAVERETLFQKLEYAHVPRYAVVEGESLPKLTSALEASILQKLMPERPLKTFFTKRTDHHVLYSRKVGYFLQILSFEPKVLDGNGNRRPPSEFKEIFFNSPAHADIALCALNSNLFYWYITAFSDCRHVNKREVNALPIDLDEIAASQDMPRFFELAHELMKQLEETSEAKQMKFAHDTLTIQFIYPKHSKPVIDEIDQVLALHYGFTDEELDFIINYDIKYRMGDDLFEDEE